MKNNYLIYACCGLLASAIAAVGVSEIVRRKHVKDFELNSCKEVPTSEEVTSIHEVTDTKKSKKTATSEVPSCISYRNNLYVLMDSFDEMPEDVDNLPHVHDSDLDDVDFIPVDDEDFCDEGCSAEDFDEDDGLSSMDLDDMDDVDDKLSPDDFDCYKAD